MRRVIFLLATVMMLGLTGCIVGGNNEVTLENTKWILKLYGERENIQTVIEGSEITVLFDSAEEEASGFSGCNYFHANYQLQDDVLTISNIHHPELYYNLVLGVMEQEREFLKIFSKAKTVEFDDSQLTIICSSDRVLVFNSE